MAFQPMHLFMLVSLAIVASHAAITSEVYWKTVLPNTPVPETIRELLPSEGKEEKWGSVGVDVGGKGGVGVDVGGKGGVGVDVGGGQSSGGGQHSGGVSIRKSHHGKNVGVNVGHQPFDYNYAATDDQLHDNPNVALFFLQKIMNPGTKMNLHFFKSSNGATFLPRQVAESIPFSSNKMTEILNRFSVKPNSSEAETMKTTIKVCEQPGIQGEEKLCATSLESMVDFSTSKQALSIGCMTASSCVPSYCFYPRAISIKVEAIYEAFQHHNKHLFKPTA